MSGFEFYELKCRRCGGELEPLSGGMYHCKSCGKTFKEQMVEDVADQLRNVLDEQKQEAVANLRRQLWAEMHEQYINSEKIVGLAREIKKYLPEDYFANFCDTANSCNDRQVSSFLNNTSKEDMACYADVVLDFMLKSVTATNLNAISLFIERAFKGDTVNYDKYITAYEKEAQNVNSGIYELTITRDVFLVYSSADMEKVLELCDFLERNKITCFLALRNLRHGRGAVDNYERALNTAIDNCKIVVFVSSKNSRSVECDAFTKELSYVRQKDVNGAPIQFRYDYDKLPQEYMMPRVEYLIEDYCGNIAERTVKEFFHGLEWCKNKEDVADRIVKYLTDTAPQNKPFEVTTKKDRNVKYCKHCGASNRQNAKFCSSCGSREFFANFDEYLASKIKFCADCGAQNNVEDKFCAECGSTQFVPTEKEYQALVETRKEKERRQKLLEEEEKRRQKLLEEEEKRRKDEEERKRKAEEAYKAEQFRKAQNMVVEAEKYYDNGEYNKVYPVITEVLKIDSNNAKAQNLMGECYYYGQEVTQSFEEAVKWYRRAAEQGHADAQWNLGSCYFCGQGVIQSYKEAVKWYLKAAEQGHADAQYNLAICYENGRGVVQSYEEASKLYRKAAEQAHTKAKNNLGNCYYYGQGVIQSYEEAAKWYQEAAEQGQADAQYNLGNCYNNGHGVTQSYEEAAKWYRKAAEQGDEYAKKKLVVVEKKLKEQERILKKYAEKKTKKRF